MYVTDVGKECVSLRGVTSAEVNAAEYGTWRVGRLCRRDLGQCLLAFADSNYEMLHKLVFIIARLSVCLSFCLRERNEQSMVEEMTNWLRFRAGWKNDGNYILMNIVLLFSQPHKDIE